ncbi:DUF1697 domain-containing protein [Asticcacaulis sp. AND118]|uniref:DUF1697 domain-containing protein n=1 Tax=Asticcacaulis sp. AND118 TaxID=2840468 RepID=UPI001CFF7CAE|nr:DUF1697 domain-containing protein [Asticcacaulis sp. AND118]UDF02493.1 DUF1697 domain-containing protein [Asticcacaulis sp. AND118]
MTICIALLRGVNVGGHNKLPMKDWREGLAALGLDNVRTYIQSGNAVFEAGGDTENLGQKVSADIGARFGFTPECHILSLDQVRAMRAACPYEPEGEDAHKQVHLMFITGPIKTYDPDGLSALATQGERFHMGEGVFYLYTPQGFGKSVLAEKLPRFLKANMTARNLRTVDTLIEMAAN